jgi:hypothetical protein
VGSGRLPARRADRGGTISLLLSRGRGDGPLLSAVAPFVGAIYFVPRAVLARDGSVEPPPSAPPPATTHEATSSADSGAVEAGTSQSLWSIKTGRVVRQDAANDVGRVRPAGVGVGVVVAVAQNVDAVHAHLVGVRAHSNWMEAHLAGVRAHPDWVEAHLVGVRAWNSPAFVDRNLRDYGPRKGPHGNEKEVSDGVQARGGSAS